MILSSAWNFDNAKIMRLIQKFILKPKIFKLEGCFNHLNIDYLVFSGRFSKGYEKYPQRPIINIYREIKRILLSRDDQGDKGLSTRPDSPVVHWKLKREINIIDELFCFSRPLTSKRQCAYQDNINIEA